MGYWYGHEWMARYAMTHDNLVRSSIYKPHNLEKSFRNNLIYNDCKRGLSLRVLAKKYNLSVPSISRIFQNKQQQMDPERLEMHELREKYIRMTEYARLHPLLDALKDIGDGQ